MPMPFGHKCSNWLRGPYTPDQCNLCWTCHNDATYGRAWGCLEAPPAWHRDFLCVGFKVLRGSCPALAHVNYIRLDYNPATSLADYGLEAFAAGETAPAWTGEFDVPGHGRVPFGLLRTGDGPGDWRCAFDRKPQQGPTTGPRVPFIRRMTSPVFPAGTWGCDGDIQLEFVVTP